LEKTKKLFWLGEFDALEKPEYMQAFDACYTWTWMHQTAEFYKGQINLADVRNVLERYNATVANNKMKLWFTSNHDENSWNGTEYEKYGDMTKALAVFSFTWDGIPLIYSGQELPNMKRLAFFEKDVIAWDGNYQLEYFYKTLNELRKNIGALNAGDADVKTYLLNTNYQDKLLVFLRKNNGNQVFVLLNFSADNIIFSTQENMLDGNYKNIFGHKINDLTGKTNFELQARGYEVWEKMWSE
jgi:glycosidase